MADKIQIKRSSEEGKKPTPEQLADGELALNLKDKKIYAKDSDGVVQEFPAVDAVDVGVEKVNDLTGEITIKGSDNINVTKSGQNITLNTTSNVALKSDLPADLNLTEGDGINITGSYPNITITNEVTKIDDLSDVDTDGKQANQVLTYNGTSWVPGLSDSGGDENVQSNWTETDQTSDAFILNKPSNLSDFNNDLTLPPADAEKNVQSDWDEATTTSDAYILNKPTNLSEFENDLTLPPSDAEKNVQSDWTEADTSADAFILNKPTNLSQFNNDINISADNVTGLPVTHLESGNELTLNVSDEGNGTWTLTALNQGGGSGGGSGNLNLIEGDCINIAAVENATDSNVTDVTIGLDTDCDSITSNLPISSTDGTVTLDSPSANTFTVSTNSVDNRLAVNGRGMVGVGNAGTNSICLYVNSVPTNATGLSGITCIPEIITADAEEVSAVKTQANLGAAVAADYFNHFITGSSAGTGTAATMNGVRIIDTSLTGTTKNVAFSTNLPADSEKNFSIETGTAPSVFAGQVQTDTITSKDGAAGDASIQLGANLTVSTGGEERVNVKPASYGSGAVTIGADHAHSIGGVSVKNDPTQVTYSSQMQVRFVDENGQYAYTGCTEPRFAVGGSYSLIDGGAFFAGHDNGNAVLFSGTGDVIIATGGLANSSERLRITDDSIQSDVDVKTSSVSGLADNDASLALGASATITVTGSGVFQVSNSGNNRALYLSPSGELGIGRLPSTGVALDVYQPTSGARFQSTSDDVNSRIIFQEGSLTDEQFSFDRYGTNFSGSTTGSVATKSAVIRNEADAALVITTGGSNTSDNNAIQLRPGASNVSVNGYALKANSDRTVEVPGDIQTSRIVGATAPDTDAAILLGAGFVVTVGSIQRIIATASNLTLDFPAIDIKQTGSEDSTELFFGGSAKDVSTFARFGKIQGRLSSDAVGSGAYEGELGFWSQIGSPPYYRTDPDIQIKADGSVAFNNGEIQTSRIVGATAPDTDAAIQLGAELLTTNHTPTQPNSIATKSYVDSSAGSAGLVPFGTPTDDTTPDSPNGSTLHDNMFLYVKGTTSWRKSALYPLDSTGGGSDFPLPQPGLDAGLEWTGYDVPVAAGSSGGGATVAAVGNAFFLLHQWSLNGTDWYPTSWADPQKLVVSPNSLTASYGQNVFCGADGYSYDGRNWTNYTLSSESQRIGSSGGSFFYQGKHYARGGSHYFNGESWLSTGMTGSGMNDDSNYVIPCDACCVGINLSSTANLQIYTAGDMSDGVNRWRFATESGTSNPVGQGLLCVARDAATDICVALTNEHAWVQTNSGSTSFRKIALPVSAAWGGITHDGNNFIAVASGENSNISIRSDDGVTWEQSTTLDNPGVTSMAGFNGRAITSGVLPGIGQSRVASILVSGNPPPSFRSFEVNGQEMKSQTQTNEFLLQEINRLQKLIEEKCSS